LAAGFGRNSSAGLAHNRAWRLALRCPLPVCRPRSADERRSRSCRAGPEIRSWRHHIHAHPETAFEEKATSAFVADKLRSFGLEVHAGLAGTGVVGVLKSGRGSGAIGLRADLDALHIHEKSGVAHASKVEGKMHACGHDGHTAMLLGAAAALAKSAISTAPCISSFQPAEENEGGGRVMVEEGLFERFPMRAVYGMHNWPLMPVGKIATRVGPLMGAFDIFEIVATGKARTRQCRTPARIRCCSPRTPSARCRRSSRAIFIRSNPASSASRRFTAATRGT
jgi:metal-dependent amidase/aminoacylase/carboxypeptidase family protein